MKKILKALALALASALLPLCAGAQEEDTDTMYVLKKNGVLTTFPVEKVSRVQYTPITGLSGSCPDDKHPHAIDLGLKSGTKWVCCNVGAKSPYEPGNKYAWGETATKDTYTKNTYTLDTLKFVSEFQDVVKVEWKDDWVMPTKTQMEELKNQCEWEYDLKHDGYAVSSKATGKEGAYIFLPSTESRWNTSSHGYYWMSTYSKDSKAYALYFNWTYINPSDEREVWRGYWVRPVQNAKK